jgi:hypothetical protein
MLERRTTRYEYRINKRILVFNTERAMKTKEEIIQPFLFTAEELGADDSYSTIKFISNGKAIDAMSELETQTREEMFEFAHWLFCDEYGWQKNGIYYRINNTDKKMTIQELFDYWKQLKK